MSKESRSTGLGVRFHTLERESKHDEEVVLPPRKFTPDCQDLARLLPKLHERERRMS